MEAARRILELIHRCEKALAVFFFTIMVLPMIADIGLRLATGAGITGAGHISVYAFFWLSLTGFGLASSASAHLRPSFVDRLTPPRWEPLMRRTQHAVTALLSLILLAASVSVVMVSYDLGEVTRSLRWPVWLLQLAFPLAFAVTTLRHGLYAFYPGLADHFAKSEGTPGADKWR